jgi:hypothetical protein
MRITRTSTLTGVTHTRDIPVKPEDLGAWLVGGMLIQSALPYLSAEDREFLLSGTTPEEWATLMPEEDDNDG